MPSGNVPPPTQHPDEPEFVCIPVNREWIPILLGALQPLKYPEYWSGTLEENRGARKDFGLLLDQIMQAEACNMQKCCVEPTVIQRVNPDTGSVEISYDGGATYEPSPNTIQKLIVTPTPPVTSGVSATKCDAAQNAQTQIEDWIAHVTTAFGVATSLVEFATAVASAILDAVLVILSGGELTAAQALIIPIIGAICAAVWTAGESLFNDYWTSENKDIIFCALFCNIGDDGTFTDTQFSSFWHQCQGDLPVGIARELFLGFMSSIGKQGLNAMTSSGIAADSDCSSCPCAPCVDKFQQGVPSPNFGGSLVGVGTVVDSGDDFFTVASVDRGDGQQVIYISAINGDDCCNIQREFVGTPPDSTISFATDCGTVASYSNMVENDLLPNPHCCTGIGLQMTPGTNWQVKFTFIDGC